VALVALSGAFPKHNEYSFLPRSPYLHDFALVFWMLYSPLNMALLLVLLQPSGDGYSRLCSSKSSFRGTHSVSNPLLHTAKRNPIPFRLEAKGGK
jgi:hypothetical protein